jgi:putative MATE family efflux protein
MKHFDSELVSGNIVRSVWKLTWPLVLVQLISGLHQLIDHYLVGNYVPSTDNEANAAIGVAWQTFLVLVVFVASFIQGMSVLIARYTGRQEPETIGRVAYHSFLMVIYLYFVIAPAGYFAAPYLLEFANADPEVRVHAVPYLRILFTCSGAMLINFWVSHAFQAIGDPRTPLALGILSTLLNVIMSFVLIIGVGPFPALGASGAAIGTCLGPLPSITIALILIIRHKTVIRLPHHFTLIPDWSVAKEILRVGLPTGVQAVLLNIGGFFLLRYVGSLEDSAAAQAAYTLCYAQLFALITWASFGLRGASSSLMGQNIGAGNPDRGKSAIHVAGVMAALWAMLLGSIFFVMPEALLGIFKVVEGPALEYGVQLLRILAISGFFLSVTLAFTGGMQGAGDTISPMVIAFLTQIGVLLGLCAYYDYTDQLTPFAIWTSILFSHMSRFGLTIIAFRNGRWRRVRVGLKS